MRPGPMRLVVAVALIPWMLACQGHAARQSAASSSSSVREADEPATYQAEVEEGLGAAVAILVDTSGSMREKVPGDSRPKYVIAQDAIENMLDATETLVKFGWLVPDKTHRYDMRKWRIARKPIAHPIISTE